MIRIVHAAAPVEGQDVVIAFCGAVGYILEDASLTPADFDFAAPDSKYVDCVACIEKQIAMVRHCTEELGA